MKRVAIFLCVLLSGCAHDAYTANDPAQQARMQSDLHDCKWDVSRKFFGHGNSDAPIILGGVLGGAIGGAIMGAAAATANSNATGGTSAQFDAMMKSCMAAKGYSGTSDD